MSRNELVKETSTDIVVFGLGSAISGIASFLLVPVYTQMLTPSELGVIALFATVKSVSITIFQLALDGALLRSYFDCGEEERQILFGTALVLVLFSISVAIGLIVMFDVRISTTIFGTQEYASFLLVVVVTACLTILGHLPLVLYRAKKLVAEYSGVQISLLVLRLGLIVYFVVVRRAGVWGFVLGDFGAALLGTVLIYVMVLGEFKLCFSRIYAKEMLSYGLPLIPGRVMYNLLLSADRYFLEHYSTLAAVGIYSLGQKFGQIIQILLVQPFKFIWPVMAFSTKDKKYAKKYYARMLTYYLYVGLFMSLIISLVAVDVLRLIARPSYWEAGRVVPMICLGLLFFGAQKMIDVGILIKRKTGNIPVITGAGLIVNLILNRALVPGWSAMGAAVANVLSYLAMIIVIYWISRGLLSVKYEWGRIVKMATVAAIIYSVGSYVHLGGVFLSLMVKVVLSSLYPLLLVLFDFYRKEEWEQLSWGYRQARARVAKWVRMSQGTVTK